jgi:regulator of sirC expression with transglutaminase-like and TPR domain
MDKSQILEKLQAFKEQSAGRTDILEDLVAMEESVKRNGLLEDLTQHEGVQVLLDYLKKDLHYSFTAILNQEGYFKDKEAYLNELDRAWRKIDQSKFILALFLSGETYLKEWDKILDEQLKNKL